jgi:hypothetical protein
LTRRKLRYMFACLAAALALSACGGQVAGTASPAPVSDTSESPEVATNSSVMPPSEPDTGDQAQAEANAYALSPERVQMYEEVYGPASRILVERMLAGEIGSETAFTVPDGGGWGSVEAKDAGMTIAFARVYFGSDEAADLSKGVTLLGINLGWVSTSAKEAGLCRFTRLILPDQRGWASSRPTVKASWRRPTRPTSEVPHQRTTSTRRPSRRSSSWTARSSMSSPASWSRRSARTGPSSKHTAATRRGS